MENLASLPKHDENVLHKACIKPFENIALAFSGGGFRAASFALGVLSYLNKAQFDGPEDPLNGKTLLQQVTYMSSASGGTIATTLYALSNAQGKDFGDFYVKLFNGLEGQFILTNALEILSDSRRWKTRKDKSRNIINAFAMAYDEYLFSGATLQQLFYSEFKGHLQEVCFNTTEFYTGLSFRQDFKMVLDEKESADEYYKYGNENVYLGHEVSGKIKLGDILAASSCFPAGFEPIVFPYDFTYDGLDGLNENTLRDSLVMVPQTGDLPEREFRAKKCMGFMDGGITDNQGLQSMMYADGRRINNQTAFKPFDLMMVNDVASYFIKPYVNPPKSPTSGGIDFNVVNFIAAVWLLLAAGLIVAGICCKSIWYALSGGVLFGLPAVFWYGYFKLMGLIKGGGKNPSSFRKNFSEKIINLLIHFFKKTPITVLKRMLKARADSVLLLNLSIFLKRVRQLLYNKFYGSTEWKGRGKGNHIYDLTFSSDIYRSQNPPPSPFLNPSRDIQVVAETAFSMGTTLWFEQDPNSKPDYKACIIACGEFTTCYNLLSYIEKLLTDTSISICPDAFYFERLNALKKQLEADYIKFKADPFFMYNQDRLKYGLTNSREITMADVPFPENWKSNELA